MTSVPENRSGIERLLHVMARLRDPESGCPWDIEQTFETIAPYTIEEAYEVAEAIRQGDMGELRDELGDLLLQVVYHARMAEEDGNFDFDAVAGHVAEKMIRRHPHVFGDDTIETAEAQTVNWEEQKAAERQRKADAAGHAPSALDGIALGLPALMRAWKLQKRAARVGFDWPKAREVLDKLDEEIAELRHELDTGGTKARVQDEVGDLLFTVANLARKLGIDPEEALRDCNAKFERRFRDVERQLDGDGRAAGDCTLEELENLWQKAKHREPSAS
ncbi:nucleoside triphosphate pyrophosphohydrolase [Ferruginivarius sediminum]|uniref:Nucleoside triphosphate pyrophosphohydrolase n=1 Tax=Ferruginivarius sediminum TaxID=2661937 RepID=A0A369TGP7_9PROT|nr:nucleoside triphosphate pyrophosphohydrolase [Ferruginivarius sediminum]RDD62086.1 nucleoside triphosphate pyrophosphohydrolase [Ferruginivarius sediminum]